MKRYSITDGQGNTFTRITRKAAQKRYDSGLGTYVIAHKLRPGYPFSMGMTLWPQNDCYGNKVPFADRVQDFCWYNATDSETGRYAAYYVESRV